MCFIRTLKKWLYMPLAAKYVWMPGRSYRGSLPELTADQLVAQENCWQHVDMLATQIGERHFRRPEKLAQARQYISERFTKYGYNVERHGFEVTEGHGQNLIAELPGRSRQIFVIGAHYDSIPGCAAANDNGSGVAALLELARRFAGRLDLSLTLRFVAFDYEEHRWDPAECMGSYFYAKHCRDDNDDIAGMWSLETIGCFSDEPDTQHYPSPFDLFYPTTGNFAGFVGSEESRHWIKRCVGAFRSVAQFPSEGVAAPARFKDVNRSDHWGFSQHGYPSLMVTDTANFRYQHYHKPEDTAEQVSYPHLARLVTGLQATIEKIAR